MSKNTPALDDMPLRGRCGYVCKYGNVKEGHLTPGLILGILRAKGALDDIEDDDWDDAKEIAEQVIEYQGVET